MEDNQPKTNSLWRWVPLVVLAALVGAAYIFGLDQILTLENLQTQKDNFQAYADENPVLSILIFLISYIFAVALSLPIATPLSLLGGFLFGKFFGTFLIVVSATFGALIIFLIAKSSLGESLREKAGGLYDRIADNMQNNAVSYLLFMRLVPLFPFFLVNIAPALFNVSWRVFALTTFFGIIPGAFVFANLGETLGEIESLKDLISKETLFAFALLGFFALIPTLYKQIKNKNNI